MSQNQYKNQYKNQFKHQFKRPCDKPTLSCWSSSMQVFFSLLPLFQRSTFSKHQISLLQGYPRLLQNFPSSRVSRARASNLPFALVSKARASNFSLSRVSRSRASHFPYCKGIRGRASSFPFSRASKGRGCSFLFSKVKGELLQGVLKLLAILYFGATLALNLLAATPGLMLKVRQEILPTKSSLEKHQVPFGFRYLLFSTKC